MQCHQPLFGFGYSAPGQCPPVYPFNVGATDIIGEGEVTAVTFPDGTIQYYFLPVRWNGSDYYAKRWPPYPFSDLYCNSYNRPSGAWIITKISNSISPLFNHCCQRTNPDPFPKPCFNYDYNANIAPGFQLKFHNDCCTSTTDLHYFCCPTLRKPIAVASTRSASVQVEAPAETKCSCYIVDSNIPGNSTNCSCSSTKEFNNKKVQCKCKTIEKKPSSCMSIDKSKTSSSSCNIKKLKTKKKKHKKSCSSCSSCYDSKRATKKRRKLVCGCDSQRNTVNKAEIPSSDQKQSAKKDSEIICESAAQNNTEVDGQRLSKKKKSKMDCCCDAQSIVDKTVVTYTDQASSVKEVEGQTQTERCLDCSCSTLDVKRVSVSKLWIPKRLRDTQSSEKIIGVYETSSSDSNRSSCSCRTSRESFK